MADQALEGVQAGNALAAAARKAAAFNALAKIYGPVAGDPEAALTMQSYGFNEKANPLKLQGLELGNRGTELENVGKEQTNTFNAELNPLKIKAQQQENDLNTELNPLKVENEKLGNKKTSQDIAQSAEAFPLEQEGRRANIAAAKTQTAVAANQLNTARAQQERTAALGILSALSDAAENGGDVGATFDKYAPVIARMEGVDAAHMAPLRQLLVNDPQGTIDKLSAALQNFGAGTGKAGALTPLQQRAQAVSSMQVIQERTAAVPGAINQALALVPKMSGSAIIRKARADLPGTAEYQFGQLMHQLQTNLALDDLRSLRASGLSLGRVTNTEFTASANAFANMDLGQNPSLLSDNLRRLSATYGRINDNLSADIKRLGTGIPGIKSTASSAAGKQQFVDGQVYQDANGNKARYQGGKWVEVK